MALGWPVIVILLGLFFIIGMLIAGKRRLVGFPLVPITA